MHFHLHFQWEKIMIHFGKAQPFTPLQSGTWFTFVAPSCFFVFPKNSRIFSMPFVLSLGGDDIPPIPATPSLSLQYCLHLHFDRPSQKLARLGKGSKKRPFLGFKFSKNGPKKLKNWKSAQKQPILGMFWCFWLTKSVLPEFRRSYKVVLCWLFAD